ncbi:MAG: hypothetical protein ACJAU6_002094 [Alphaproteobacteria bacterium]|jgi:hypothetical protein
MVARVQTIAFQGVDTLDIDVQVHMANGLPAFTIVGLPDKAVGESRERVRRWVRWASPCRHSASRSICPPPMS